MPIINTERFVDALVKSPSLVLESTVGWDGNPVMYPKRTWRSPLSLRERIIRALGKAGAVVEGDRSHAIYTQKFDRESALQVYEDIKEHIKARGMLEAKELRPWQIDPEVYGSLDPNVPWLGFEFETGWKDTKARADAIEHCWNTWDNVVFDSEGEGGAPVEITFAPAELSKYEDGTADAYQFVEFLNGNKNTSKGTNMMVGTHVNISLPFMRGFSVGGGRDYIKMGKLGVMMGRTIGTLGPQNSVEGNENRRKYFGRERLYAGAYPGDGMTWMEFKVFRTTYDLEQFKTYLATSKALVRCLQALYDNSDNFTKKGWSQYYVSNFKEMIDDESVEPVLEKEEDRFSVDFNGRPVPTFLNYYDDEDDYDDDDDYEDEEDDDWEPDDEPEEELCSCEACTAARASF